MKSPCKLSCKRNDISKRFEISNRFEFTSGLIFKEKHIVEENPSEKNVTEELGGIDIDDTGKLEDLLRIYEDLLVVESLLDILTKRKNQAFYKPATLLKLTLLHGCFSRFLNCTNGTKSRNASHNTN